MSIDWDKPIRFRDDKSRLVVDYARWESGVPAIVGTAKGKKQILVDWEGPFCSDYAKVSPSELENVPPAFAEYWCNVYADWIGEACPSRDSCGEIGDPDVVAIIHVLIQNEGDKPVITVHDV